MPTPEQKTIIKLCGTCQRVSHCKYAEAFRTCIDILQVSGLKADRMNVIDANRAYAELCTEFEYYRKGEK